MNPISRAQISPPLYAGPGVRLRSGGRGAPLGVDALLDDVRRAMAHSPEAARIAAVRLVKHLTPTTEANTERFRGGGLAPWQMRKLSRYLQENLERPLYVEDIANQITLSVGYFCRVFKKSFGTTPHMYIVRLRLELAKRLMLTTEDPLSQIALACGLADQAHLSKLFRRNVGETPSAWRKQNLTEAHVQASSHATRRRFVDQGSSRAGLGREA